MYWEGWFLFYKKSVLIVWLWYSQIYLYVLIYGCLSHFHAFLKLLQMSLYIGWYHRYMIFKIHGIKRYKRINCYRFSFTLFLYEELYMCFDFLAPEDPSFVCKCSWYIISTEYVPALAIFGFFLWKGRLLNHTETRRLFVKW